MKKEDKFPYELPKIPFFYSIQENKDNPAGISNSNNLVLDINYDTGTLIQKGSHELDEILEKAYKQGSKITGCLDEYYLAEKYIDDFFEFIKRSEINICNADVLEIGCATGYLLNRFKENGANVFGIEPGEQYKKGIERYNLDIIQGYYPDKRIERKFDIIVLYNVFEHISDLKELCSAIKGQLKPNGVVLISVPDCENNIENGDVSMLLHEHFNYFERNTLSNTVKVYFGEVPYIEKSNFGCELYSLMRNNSNTIIKDIKVQECVKRNSDYIEKLEDILIKFESFLKKIDLKENRLGIYVPARAINILELLKEKIDMNNIEFYDDDTQLNGKYYPGFNIEIRGRKELIQNPPQYILIMSSTFKNQILKTLTNINSNILGYDEVIKGDF